MPNEFSARKHFADKLLQELGLKFRKIRHEL